MMSIGYSYREDFSEPRIGQWLIGILVGLILIYVLIVFLPWIAIYALVPVALSVGIGYGLRRSCECPNGYAYERLGVWIPVTALLMSGFFYLLRPNELDQARIMSESLASQVIRETQIEQAKFGKRNSKAISAPVEVTRSMYADSWNAMTSKGKAWWLDHVFPSSWQSWLGLDGPMRFRYEHGVWLGCLVFFLGIPLSFLLFLRQGWSAYELQLQRQYGKEADALRLELTHCKDELQQAQKALQELREKATKRVQELRAEIERLKLREKYLTDGKPKPLEATPAKPNLDMF